jgi:antitoxin (DNA-binding transcriptional repressor) of toxin-antitoxin stability system
MRASKVSSSEAKVSSVGGVRTLGVREMRAGYDVLHKALEQGGEVLLTHHGKPFARVLPLESVIATKPKVRSLAVFRAKQKFQTTPSEVLIREDRDSRDF